MPVQKARLGWKPDLPDHRDYKYSAVVKVDVASLPDYSDLRAKCPPIDDQLTLSSCTGDSGASFGQFIQTASPSKTIKSFKPSRLFIYWNSRQQIGEEGQDAGATIRDTMKVMSSQGMPPESLWWYNPGKVLVKPNQKVYTEALKCRLGNYFRLNGVRVNELRQCISGGFPFVFGFAVYESFLSDLVAKTGIVPLPSSREELVGGHAVMAVGYDHNKRVFICRNSWGDKWGLKGYFTMPYDYVTNSYLSDDFWTARNIIWSEETKANVATDLYGGSSPVREKLVV